MQDFYAGFLVPCINYRPGHVYLPLLLMFAFNRQGFQSKQISLRLFWRQLSGREKSKLCQFSMIISKVHGTHHKITVKKIAWNDGPCRQFLMVLDRLILSVKINAYTPRTSPKTLVKAGHSNIHYRYL